MMKLDILSSARAEFTSLDGVRSKLDTFFTRPGMRILMIKGAWGTGKSYFVRDYITQAIRSQARSRILPKWIAYASAFGCNSIQQLEGRISESLQPKSLWNRGGSGGFVTTIRKIFYALLIRLIGDSFVSPISSIVWHFTRSREVLVVIDDLERSHNDLRIKEILGFVSSLAENSCDNLKVILICNTERLIQSNADDLSILREKVIHSELVFNPSPKELIVEFFGHEEQSSTMLECLSIIGEGNIRIVSRVSVSLTEIVRLFEPTGVTLSAHDKNEIVRLCVFYFRADEAIGADWFQLHQKKQLEAISSSTGKTIREPAHELVHKLEVEWSDFGPLVLQWLNLGDVEKDALSAVVKKVQDKQLNTEYQQRAEEAYSAFNNNFLETNLERVTGPLTDFLDTYAEKMSAHALMQHFNSIKQYNIDPNPWIIKHVKAWLPKMDLSLCNDYLKWLPTGEAKECVQSRLESLALERSPKDVIWNAVKNSGWSQDEMAFLANVSVDSYQKWLLQEDDPTTLQKLRSFMRFYSYNGTEPKDEACRRISAALHAMAAQNSLHQLRASVFGLLDAVDEVPGSKKG